MPADSTILLYQSRASSVTTKYTYEVAALTGRLTPYIGDMLTESQAQDLIHLPRTKVTIKPAPKRC